MEFNRYIWNLYKQSDRAKEMIALFQDASANVEKLKTLMESITDGSFYYEETIDFADYPKESGFIISDLIKEFGATNLSFNLIESIAFHIKGNLTISSIDEIYSAFQEIKAEGIIGYHKNLEQEMKAVYSIKDEMILTNHHFCEISVISIGLYISYPEYFVPYFFERRLYQVEQICEHFGIPFPEISKKKDIEGRSRYYFDLCRVLYEFRIAHDLTPAEMCAFLYDFALQFVEKSEDVSDLPAPSKVWIVGGGINNNGDFNYLDEINDMSRTTWNGNKETRRGDIVIMYCLSPRSSIHSIWRAVHDGYVEPYFHWYSMIEIGFPVKVMPTSFIELKTDLLFSQNGLVKMCMQGVNGKGWTVTEYNHFLEMLSAKGQDISKLPRIEQIAGIESADVQNERDVEIKLIEPFLIRLGYAEKDWIRQMPIRMGRGVRYYPDYVFGANCRRGEEKAKMILEAKYQIVTKKDLFEAYYQAKSYTMRLEAEKFVLASKEGIWIFDKNELLSENVFHKTWNELTDADHFHQGLIRIGKHKTAS